ncbi:ATP synthase F0 subunit 8 (mitochondrion) [Chrysochloris asiatica]|uniref:ATP synthase complex subunit 8 n=1 Tax=Chrysochloris asiatica TaxID=185453 RepID=Q7Y8J0_CHRAS|nr:ATP synthase F0 subunit 8 [Chrysochloris asiatica]BAC78416.1 ATPase subunit8 [Chrysochloris asiatica]CAD21964.1 ATPase subunit 8 [Chrysochloris asiatica]
MPQLDTNTWFITIISATLTLFILFQINFSKLTFYLEPEPKLLKSTEHKNPWETKWTKIYLPHSSLPH